MPHLLRSLPQTVSVYIGIVHNREFEEAVLHVEFYEEMAKIKAAELLRKYRYTIYER